jgi:hypothetical protein
MHNYQGRMVESKGQIQNGDRVAKLLVNLWTEVMSQCFSAKSSLRTCLQSEWDHFIAILHEREHMDHSLLQTTWISNYRVIMEAYTI